MSYEATEEELKLLREMFDVLRFCRQKISEQEGIAYQQYLYKVIDYDNLGRFLMDAGEKVEYCVGAIAEYLNPLYKEPIKEYR